MAGIYLHVPFCNSRCIYCGFCSTVSRNLRQKYIPALKREISGRRDFFSSLYESDQRIKTLYIGGGTPSVLPPDTLQEAVSAIRETFKIAEEYEFTIEVNPDDITEDYASSLRKMGVNRVSMGVQSFKDSHLRWMRRRHDSATAINAYNILRKAGFDNISLDLIFGFPLMTIKDWEENLDRITDLNPEHISAYQMGIDPETPLERMEKAGDFFLPSQEESEEMYTLLQKKLKEGGYIQYEVSNFCKPDRHSRHNSSYWNRTPYLGLGPGAHSFIGKNREWNTSDIATWCDLSTLQIREGETLSPEDVFNEILMLGLRTTKGVNLNTLRNCATQSPVFLSDLLPKISAMESKGLITLTKDGTIKIPPERFFISDGIIRELFVC
ncbi:MAG: radical SAM family heme chaperone HemW [Bacteroidales bacterium]|nr:radical SAM family heme chaperone HemW [Bacteroidales bacterium]